jgi:hypothetical protein
MLTAMASTKTGFELCLTPPRCGRYASLEIKRLTMYVPKHMLHRIILTIRNICLHCSVKRREGGEKCLEGSSEGGDAAMDSELG